MLSGSLGVNEFISSMLPFPGCQGPVGFRETHKPGRSGWGRRRPHLQAAATAGKHQAARAREWVCERRDMQCLASLACELSP